MTTGAPAFTSPPAFQFQPATLAAREHDPYRDLAAEVVLLALADAHGHPSAAQEALADIAQGGLDRWIALLGWGAQEEQRLRSYLDELVEATRAKRTRATTRARTV